MALRAGGVFHPGDTSSAEALSSSDPFPVLVIEPLPPEPPVVERPGKGGGVVVGQDPYERAAWDVQAEAIGKRNVAKLAIWNDARVAWNERHPDEAARAIEAQAEAVRGDLSWLDGRLVGVLQGLVQTLVSEDRMSALVAAEGRDETWTVTTAEVEAAYRAERLRGFTPGVREAVETALGPLRADLARAREGIRLQIEDLGTLEGRFRAIVQETRRYLRENPNVSPGEVWVGVFVQNWEFTSVANVLTPDEFALWNDARERLARVKRQRDWAESAAIINTIPVLITQLTAALIYQFNDRGGLGHDASSARGIWINWVTAVVRLAAAAVPVLGPTVGIVSTVALAAVQVAANVAVQTTTALLATLVQGLDFDATGYAFGIAGSVAGGVAPIGGAVAFAGRAGQAGLAVARPVVDAALDGREPDWADLGVAAGGIAGAVGGVVLGGSEGAAVTALSKGGAVAGQVALQAERIKRKGGY